MKKIVVMFIAGLMAVAVNAETVSWTCSNVLGTDGTTKNAGIGYLVEASLLSEAQSVLAGTDASAAATWFADNSVNSFKPTTAGTYASPKTEYASGAASFVAVIFGDVTVADSSNYFVTSVVSGSVPGSGNKAFAFGNLSAATSAAGAYTSAGWASDVPEPTSGLLLLFGGALLALRRKRK